MRTAVTAALLFALAVIAAAQDRSPRLIRFVFTSDAHYGITRPAFRGILNAPGSVVNAALVKQINRLTPLVGPVDFLAEGGDIANRSEADERIQPAAVSWAQFTNDYLDHLTLQTPSGARTPVFVVPGNHDASNAVGFYKTMAPAIDKTSMAEIFNLMMAPARRTTATYDYATDRVLTSRDLGGVHFVFLTVWPDSAGRAWLARDLEHVGSSTPVVVFTHDQPDAESKHFTNPNGAHGINDTDRFENLLSDTFADGRTTRDDDRIEQAAWEDFVKRHQNIAAYFHGNSNWNEFYDWTGPHHAVALHTFRVDSPMKGRFSQKDETKLSFQVATIETTMAGAMTLTVRECLWNTEPLNPSAPINWGASSSVRLQ